MAEGKHSHDTCATLIRDLARFQAVAICAIVVGVVAAPSAHATVTIEAAWGEVFTAATADGSSDDWEGRGGLDVELSGQAAVAVSYPTGLFATARTTATNLAHFDGASSFSDTFTMSILTDKLDRFPQALARTRLWVDFRVEEQDEAAPLWTLTDSILNSTYTSPLAGTPQFSIVGHDVPSVAPGGICIPGSYTAFMDAGIGNPSYAAGSADWSGVATLNFTTPFTTAPGFDQTDPILPELPDPGDGGGSSGGSGDGGKWIFQIVDAGGGWYDPPITSGYLFETTDGGQFTDILNFPSGFDGGFTVIVDEQVVGTFGPGEPVNF